MEKILITNPEDAKVIDLKQIEQTNQFKTWFKIGSRQGDIKSTLNIYTKTLTIEKHHELYLKISRIKLDSVSEKVKNAETFTEKDVDFANNQLEGATDALNQGMDRVFPS
jgi:hypothetical protein